MYIDHKYASFSNSDYYLLYLLTSEWLKVILLLFKILEAILLNLLLFGEKMGGRKCACSLMRTQGFARL